MSAHARYAVEFHRKRRWASAGYCLHSPVLAGNCWHFALWGRLPPDTRSAIRPG